MFFQWIGRVHVEDSRTVEKTNICLKDLGPRGMDSHSKPQTTKIKTLPSNLPSIGILTVRGLPQLPHKNARGWMNQFSISFHGLALGCCWKVVKDRVPGQMSYFSRRKDLLGPVTRVERKKKLYLPRKGPCFGSQVLYVVFEVKGKSVARPSPSSAFVLLRCRAKRKHLKTFQGLLPEKWLKSRPESSLYCTACWRVAAASWPRTRAAYFSSATVCETRAKKSILVTILPYSLDSGAQPGLSSRCPSMSSTP